MNSVPNQTEPMGGQARSASTTSPEHEREYRQRFAAQLLLELPEADAEPVSTTTLGEAFRLDLAEQVNLLWPTLLQLQRRRLVQAVARPADRHWRRTAVIARVLAALPAPTEEPMSTTTLGGHLGLTGWQRADTLIPALDYLARCGLIARLHHDTVASRWRRSPAGHRHVPPTVSAPTDSAVVPTLFAAASRHRPARRPDAPVWHTFLPGGRR